jgi:hypothetical protein
MLQRVSPRILPLRRVGCSEGTAPVVRIPIATQYLQQYVVFAAISNHFRLHDSKNIDGTQTRKKTVPSKQAQSLESLAQIGGAQCSDGNSQAPLEFRVPVLF